MTDRPVLGISTYFEDAQWGGGVWRREAAVLPRTYVDTAVAADTVPVLLPPVLKAGSAASALRGVDALVLSGGADVDPALYGAARHPQTGASQPERDAWEVALFRAALAGGVPVLGICRGMQLMTVALGGVLHQHVPDVVGTLGHQPVLGTFGTTNVRTKPGSRTAAIVGADVPVACHHHQSVRSLDNTGLVATAWSEDGTVEAVESPDHPFVLAVQWHPEERTETALFTALAGHVQEAGR